MQITIRRLIESLNLIPTNSCSLVSKCDRSVRINDFFPIIFCNRNLLLLYYTFDDIAQNACSPIVAKASKNRDKPFRNRKAWIIMCHSNLWRLFGHGRKKINYVSVAVAISWRITQRWFAHVPIRHGRVCKYVLPKFETIWNKGYNELFIARAIRRWFVLM